MNITDKVLKREIIDMSPKKLQNLFTFYTKSINNFQDSSDIPHSLRDNKLKISVKVSRLLQPQKKINHFLENYFSSKKLIKHIDSASTKFICNFQQVKLDYMDCMYGYLLFDDIIYSFKINKKQLLSDPKLNYITYQHHRNNHEGQFHIKKHNIDHLINTYGITKIEYKDLLNFGKEFDC